ncbi:MAG: hypothetical protein C4547_04325 [Phycisphaerales bacterium]|nr:MAG: hypothetical protein C4547_04325 [Phycisphaerales bacterium]
MLGILGGYACTWIPSGTSPQVSQLGKPEALVLAESQRLSFQTGEIQWKSEKPDGYQRHFSARFCPTSRLRIECGDSTGAVVPHRAGEPYSYSEFRQLVATDREWTYIEDSPSAEATPIELATGVADVLALGFLPYYTSGTAMRFENYCLGEALSYSVADDAGLKVVTAHLQSGGKQVWWLDDTVGGNPVRCALISEDKVVAESQTTYREYAGGRFVDSISYYDSTRNLRRRDIVLDASFDQPWHSQQLGPKEIGVLEGMMVGGRDLVGVRPARWDGAKIITHEMYTARVEAGLLDPSPYLIMLERVREQGGPGVLPNQPLAVDLVIVAREPGLWERYTRTFVLTHALDTERARQAWCLLRQCQGLAYEILKTQRPRLDEVERVRTDLRREIEAEDTEVRRRELSERKLERLSEDEKMLLAPVRRLFEECLQRKLFALLTPEERARSPMVTSASEPPPRQEAERTP